MLKPGQRVRCKGRVHAMSDTRLSVAGGTEGTVDDVSDDNEYKLPTAWVLFEGDVYCMVNVSMLEAV